MRRLIINKYTLASLSLNMALLAVGIYQRGGPREFHFIYEPLAIQLHLLINIPAVIVADRAARPFVTNAPSVSIMGIPTMEFVVFVFASALQWIIIGGIAQFLKLRKSGSSLP